MLYRFIFLCLLSLVEQRQDANSFAQQQQPLSATHTWAQI